MFVASRLSVRAQHAASRPASIVTRSVASAALAFARHGQPTEVLKFHNFHVNWEDQPVGPRGARLRLVGAPIHPADINTIEGVYPIRPGALPAIGGNEGVFEVVELGAEVQAGELLYDAPRPRLGSRVDPGADVRGAELHRALLQADDGAVGGGGPGGLDAVMAAAAAASDRLLLPDQGADAEAGGPGGAAAPRSPVGLAVGDWVVLPQAGAGTWRSVLAVDDCRDLLLVQRTGCYLNGESNLTPAEAATMSINPLTAYRLLADFLPGGGVQPGMVILQNAANSAVGLAVIQLAQALGHHTVNVIRARGTADETEALRRRLLRFGATVVLTEEELKARGRGARGSGGAGGAGAGPAADPEAALAAALNDRPVVTHPSSGRLLRGVAETLGRPASAEQVEALRAGEGAIEAHVAFNAVCGVHGSELSRHLRPGASVVTYGGLARAPLSVGAGPFIFNDIAARGFWLTRWAANADLATRQRALDSIALAVRRRIVVLPTQAFPFDEEGTGRALRAATGAIGAGPADGQQPAFGDGRKPVMVRPDLLRMC
ncbi:hypothetical protein H696_01836 [Fonticula alba]|uniref:Enoyl reductase (ER) domain-containing protein n=1 Tax=Fonticula alba TaxID=691883 RepID=A0A058Z998_FONAL|nr:hypothetical protein H696_01836 [Fonticula alba]KCV70889.1 hypothetical protein H696_01836 [Fonticula alba]|eukprot:XP_009494012.1 hypothetical protein H696_01836 [Fonticula alba]